MDEFKIIFWIIIALIYLFTRGKKKNQQQTRPAPRPATETSEENDTPQPVTFEELLREIERSKMPSAPAPPVNPYRPPVKPEPQYVDYDDDLKEEREVVEDTNYDYRQKDKIYDVYEEAKKQAFERPSLEETVKLKDTIVRFKQFEGYEQKEKKNPGEDILKDFKDPAGFRKAFVMSEILRRKF